MDGYENLFDAALSDADERIIGVMGVTVTPLNPNVKPFRAVFDHPAADTTLPNGAARIQDTAPTLFAKTPFFTGLTEGDGVHVNGEDFRVVKIGPDDTGSCVVTLSQGSARQAPPVINGRSPRNA